VRAECPDEPGVYGMVDRTGRLIYVGVSRRLKKRLLTYFSSSRAPRKEHRIGRHTVGLWWEVAGHEFPALLRERELILRFLPHYNVQGRHRGREPGYIYLSGGEAPRFRISFRVPADARRSWGSLPNNRLIREAVERLNHVLRLSDCPNHVPMLFADQPQLFENPPAPQCLRGQIATCLAPCAAYCTRRAYQTQVRRGIAFLDGTDTAPLDRLQEEMQAAAGVRQFERATRLRDDWEALSEIRRQLEFLRAPPDPRCGIYEVECGGRRTWYLLGDGLLTRAVAAPSTRAAARALLEPITQLESACEEQTRAIGRATQRLVRSWFRHRPEELAHVLTIDEALRCCRELSGARRTRRVARAG
jgi:excinuclease ABC subunit C